mmetsp:Transcript_43025/g.129177  ORF Transcript_43025/g.129177 Transcript_43025/m.129177 type:complete len:324 (-) Transcript_43025:7535-8506(-)
MRRAADCPCSARRSCFRVLESRLECPLSRLVIGCLEHPACRLVASGLECAASWTRRRCQCSSLPRGGLSPRQSALVSHSRDHCVDARPPVCAAGTPLTRLAQRHRLHVSLMLQPVSVRAFQDNEVDRVVCKIGCEFTLCAQKHCQRVRLKQQVLEDQVVLGSRLSGSASCAAAPRLVGLRGRGLHDGRPCSCCWLLAGGLGRRSRVGIPDCSCCVLQQRAYAPEPVRQLALSRPVAAVVHAGAVMQQRRREQVTRGRLAGRWGRSARRPAGVGDRRVQTHLARVALTAVQCDVHRRIGAGIGQVARGDLNLIRCTRHGTMQPV